MRLGFFSLAPIGLCENNLAIGSTQLCLSKVKQARVNRRFALLVSARRRKVLGPEGDLIYCLTVKCTT